MAVERYSELCRTLRYRLFPADGTYTYPNSGSFEITNNASGGELTVNSDAPNIATVSLSGNTVTVKPRYNSWKG